MQQITQSSQLHTQLTLPGVILAGGGVGQRGPGSV